MQRDTCSTLQEMEDCPAPRQTIISTPISLPVQPLNCWRDAEKDMKTFLDEAQVQVQMRLSNEALKSLDLLIAMTFWSPMRKTTLWINWWRYAIWEHTVWEWHLHVEEQDWMFFYT